MEKTKTAASIGCEIFENLFSATAPGLPPEWSWGERVTDRQERIAGYNQEAIEQAFVWIFGCNGLGRTAAEFIVRKGYGRVGLCDPDVVEPTNLHRTVWSRGAVGRFKVVQAMTELCEIAPGCAQILAYVGPLQEVLVNASLMSGVMACLVGIDNDEGRAQAAVRLLELQIPSVFYALSPDTFTYEIFVQEPGKACWACVHPDRFEQALRSSNQTPCPKVPSIVDPCLIAVGYCLYALDSLFMNRGREWNFRQGHLHGEIPEIARRIEPSLDCPACAGKEVGHETPIG